MRGASAAVTLHMDLIHVSLAEHHSLQLGGVSSNSSPLLAPQSGPVCSDSSTGKPHKGVCEEPLLPPPEELAADGDLALTV